MIEQFGVRRPIPFESPHRGGGNRGLNLRFTEESGEPKEIAPGILETLRVQSHPICFGIMSLLDGSSGLRNKDLLPQLNELPYVKNNKKYEVLSQSTLSHLVTELRERGLVKEREGKWSGLELTEYGKKSMKAYDRYRKDIEDELTDALSDHIRRQLGEDWYAKLMDRLKAREPMKDMRFHSEVSRVMRMQGDPLRLAAMLALAGGASNFKSIQLVIGTGLAPATVSNVIAELEERLLLQRSGRGEYSLTGVGRTAMKAFRTYHDTLVGPLVEHWRQETNAKFETNIQETDL